MKGIILSIPIYTLDMFANMHRARILGYSSRLACSGWPDGFLSTCFIHLSLESEEEVI